MHSVCRIKDSPGNISAPALLPIAFLWLLSGCMTQAVRHDDASITTADAADTARTVEAVAPTAPTTPMPPDEPPELPKHEAPVTVTPAANAPATKVTSPVRTEQLAKKIKTPSPASEVVAAPAENPDKQADIVTAPATMPDKQAETNAVADSSADDKLAIADPAGLMPGVPLADTQEVIQRTDIMHLDLGSLPLSFGQQWVLDRRPNPATNETQCILASEAVGIPDGYDKTNVRVLLTPGAIYVNTDSNIDLSYPQTGIRIGTDPLRPFDKLSGETTAIVSGDDVSALYIRMASNPDLVVRLGFWPTWPVTETREASYSLEDFRTALMALRACNRM